MAKKSYSELLKHPLWQKKRLKIMSRDKWRCKKCGDNETTLNVHHKLYIDGAEPWDYPNEYLITLCEDCHKQIEEIKKDNPSIEFDKIKITKIRGWSGGGKIILSSYPGLLSMELFGEEENYIIGYNFSNKEKLQELMKAVKYSIK